MTKNSEHRLQVVADIHWCWFATPAGNLTAKTELLDLKKKHPRAVANIIVAMNRVDSGDSRSIDAKPLRDGILEIRARDGAVQIRVLYFLRNPHRVAVTAFVKKTGKVDPTKIDSAAKARNIWLPSDCIGVQLPPDYNLNK